MAIFSKYVIHEHDAKRAGKHYDLRIQIPRKRLLASWALPKGRIPQKYLEKVLAIRTNDHGNYWLFFQGEIPEGEYGAGTIKIIESGQVEVLGWSNKFITIKANGKLLNGRFHLNKFRPEAAIRKANEISFLVT